jgi:hypothetical protein
VVASLQSVNLVCNTDKNSFNSSSYCKEVVASLLSVNLVCNTDRHSFNS